MGQSSKTSSDDESSSSDNTSSTATAVNQRSQSSVPLNMQSSTVSDGYIHAPNRSRQDGHCHVRLKLDKRTLLRKIRIAALTLFVDLGLPIALYFILRVQMEPVYALMIAGVPPLITVIVKMVAFGSFDILGIMAFLAFTISAVVALATGDARVLLLEKSIVTGVLGTCFLITLAPIQFTYTKGVNKYFESRPAVHFIIQELVPLEQAIIVPARGNKPAVIWDRWEKIYTKQTRYAFDVVVLTALWGVILFLEFLGRFFMVMSPMDVDQVVQYGNLWFALCSVIGAIITALYVLPMVKRFSPQLEELEDQVEAARHEAGYFEEELIEIKQVVPT
ncbi:hypothetical protein SeLEV6574_g08497 [Synchytrium endobioticum]|uniref:Uncharacterized protein n=1 Tax=Synchytrium endobioticum TaxID=286115 RepID=A0A507BSB7_9FUNG|nr:hypothetical protein SeLEV6574_g08497 [Synchytrium endobioticum]